MFLHFISFFFFFSARHCKYTSKCAKIRYYVHVQHTRCHTQVYAVLLSSYKNESTNERARARARGLIDNFRLILSAISHIYYTYVLVQKSNDHKQKLHFCIVDKPRHTWSYSIGYNSVNQFRIILTPLHFFLLLQWTSFDEMSS